MEQGYEPIQPDDDYQEDISETSGPCNSQLGDSESDSIQSDIVGSRSLCSRLFFNNF